MWSLRWEPVQVVVLYIISIHNGATSDWRTLWIIVHHWLMVLKSGVLCSVKRIFVTCSSLEYFVQRSDHYLYPNGHRWKFRQTINGHRSRRFPKTVCHKRHNCGESGSWLFHHISAPADRSGLVQLHPQLFCLSDLYISLPISMYYPFSRIWKPCWRDASYRLQKRQMRLVWCPFGEVKKA